MYICVYEKSSYSQILEIRINRRNANSFTERVDIFEDIKFFIFIVLFFFIYLFTQQWLELSLALLIEH